MILSILVKNLIVKYQIYSFKKDFILMDTCVILKLLIKNRLEKTSFIAHEVVKKLLT